MKISELFLKAANSLYKILRSSLLTQTSKINSHTHSATLFSNVTLLQSLLLRQLANLATAKGSRPRLLVLSKY